MDRRAAPARADLFLAEYGSLRSESAHALESQHKIIEWTIGAFALVFVAALAVTEERTGSGSQIVRLALFGAVLPLLLLASAASWMNELYRMERVGAFLRCREKGVNALANAPEAGSAALSVQIHDPAAHPMLWEIAIHSHEKERRNFASGFLVFGAGLAICLLVFSLLMWMSGPIRWYFVPGQVLAAAPLLLYILTLPSEFRTNEHDLHGTFEPHEAYRDWRSRWWRMRAFWEIVVRRAPGEGYPTTPTDGEALLLVPSEGDAVVVPDTTTHGGHLSN